MADTIDIATKKVVIAHNTIFRTEEWLLAPRTQDFVLSCNSCAISTKAIRHDLVHHALVEPLGYFVRLFVHGKLPRLNVVVEQTWVIVTVDTDLVFVANTFHAEVVPVEALG